MSAKTTRMCRDCLTRWDNSPLVPRDCPECGGESLRTNIPNDIVRLIREAERRRLAALLTENAETIGTFIGEGERAVHLVALLLSLGIGESQ